MSGIKSVTKYTVSIPVGKEGKIKEVTFNSEREALEALAKVELAGKAQAYVAQLKDKDGAALGEKDQKGKYNVILAYLAYEAATAEPVESAVVAAPAEPSVHDEKF